MAIIAIYNSHELICCSCKIEIIVWTFLLFKKDKKCAPFTLKNDHTSALDQDQKNDSWW